MALAYVDEWASESKGINEFIMRLKNIYSFIKSFYFTVVLCFSWYLTEIVLLIIAFIIGAYFIFISFQNLINHILHNFITINQRYAEILISLLILIYTGIKLKISRDEMFERLFSDFNKRFDCMNENLNKIREGNYFSIGDSKQDNEGQQINNIKKTSDEIVKDYLNLCAEEFLWYKKFRIEPKVWSAWCDGMCFYLAHDKFKNIVEKQRTENKSYYYLFDYLTPNKLQKYKFKNMSQFQDKPKEKSEIK